MARLTFFLFLAAPLAAGSPWVRHTIDASGKGADGVRLEDVNGDGLPDIATGWEESGVVRIYLNPGPAAAAEPWPAVTVGNVASPEDAVFLDIGGDGVFEVVSATEGGEKTLYIHAAPADGYRDPAQWTTRPVARSAGKAQWMFAAPLDVDGNGTMDLVAGSKNDFAAIGSWRFPATPGGKASWSRWYGAGWVMSIVAHDMNGDGAVDIVASDRKGPRSGVLWFTNMPGSAAWPVSRIGPEGAHEAMFLDIADLDGDSVTDVVLAVRGGPIQFYRGLSARGNRWRAHAVELPGGFGTGKAVAVGDLDLDGKADIAFSCEGAEGDLSGVGLLRQTGDPTAGGWEAHDVGGPEGVKFDRLELVDLDGDGDLDLLTSEEADGLGVVWYENPTR